MIKLAFKILLLIISIVSGNEVVFSQNSIITAGSNITGQGGSVSYSIGQPCYTPIQNSDFVISQGVQQPFEISVITEIEEFTGLQLQINTFPNPSSDKLTIFFLDPVSETFTYNLLDINGRLIETKLINNQSTEVLLSNLSASTYFIKISAKNDTLIKTFKIVKN